MRYTHEIQQIDNPGSGNGTWYTVILEETGEDYEGTAAEYGREVLENWLADQEDDELGELVDEYGNGKFRVLVRFEGADRELIAATVEHGRPAEPDLETLDEAAAWVQHIALLHDIALGSLSDALRVSRAAGRGANRLADRVAPSVSRPVALRMMRPEPEPQS